MADASTVGLLGAFGGGVVSFLSPCVAPLVPGYLAMISGSVGGKENQSRWGLFTSSVVFVAGFSLVFVALGASASAFGNLILADYRREMAQVAGVLMIVMGLVLLWGFRLPFLMAERKIHYTPRRFTHSETLLIGMAFGFGWTPCFGPILASILALTSTVEGVRQGTILLAAYSLGLGLPFLLVGLGLGYFQRVLRFFTRHMGAVVASSAAVMIMVGVLFATGQVFRIAVETQRWVNLG
ncbi:MAG TPA: cytochrome c biogenesis protein CcdA [Thermomicrobiales bacterium]|nr:cytochrome c biogenesis protein CcdA [Thermomicrobiales bacterium]